MEASGSKTVGESAAHCAVPGQPVVVRVKRKVTEPGLQSVVMKRARVDTNDCYVHVLSTDQHNPLDNHLWAKIAHKRPDIQLDQNKVDVSELHMQSSAQEQGDKAQSAENTTNLDYVNTVQFCPNYKYNPEHDTHQPGDTNKHLQQSTSESHSVIGCNGHAAVRVCADQLASAQPLPSFVYDYFVLDKTLCQSMCMMDNSALLTDTDKVLLNDEDVMWQGCYNQLLVNEPLDSDKEPDDGDSDSNDENNWRCDYPEESDSESERDSDGLDALCDRWTDVLGHEHEYDDQY